MKAAPFPYCLNSAVRKSRDREIALTEERSAISGQQPPYPLIRGTGFMGLGVGNRGLTEHPRRVPTTFRSRESEFPPTEPPNPPYQGK